MSTTIDERVVEMRFDNKDFERNVSTSLSTLDKLKQSLNLNGASKGLENVAEAAKGCDMSVLSGAVETVKVRFSALETIAVTALANITNSVINTGRQMLNSLTIAPVKQGFDEYELKMNSVQTIMAGTGESLETVMGYLEDLNTYADRTIYSFSDMTSNIGKFTNAGVKLEDAVGAIQGVANVAAVSGANANEASRAMYNFAQALSAGYVKLIDWKSIENANMATVEFKTQLLESAVAAGTLEKTADGMYKVLTTNANGSSMKDAISATANFNDSLAYQWMTTEVLTSTLNDYADETTEIGKKAFAAAEDVKTFTQLMDTLQESVGSGWATTWELIFGNFDEAKELWTNVNNVVGTFIQGQSDARNAILQEWKDLGGRTALIDALAKAYEGLVSVVKPVSEAFHEVFPAITGRQLAELTEKFKEFTSTLTLSDGASKNLKSTFKGLFSVFDIFKQAITAVAKPILSMLGYTDDLAGGVLSVTGRIGDWLTKLDEMVTKSDIFNKVVQTIVTWIKTAATEIKNFGNEIKEKFDFSWVEDAKKVWQDFVEQLKAKVALPGAELIHTILQKIHERLSQVGEAAGNMKNVVLLAFDALGNALSNFKGLTILQSIWNVITRIASAASTLLSDALGGIVKKLSNTDFNGILDFVNSLSLVGLVAMFKKVSGSASGVLDGLTDTLEGLSGIKDSVVGILNSVKDCLTAYQDQLRAKTLMTIATAVAVLAASLVTLSLIDSEKLMNAIVAISVLFAELSASSAITSKYIDGKDKGFTKTAAAMIAMSAAILILAVAMKQVSGLDYEELMTSIIGLTAVAVIMVEAMKELTTKKGIIIEGASNMVLMAAAIKILASVCKEFSGMSWEELIKGLIGLDAAIGEMVSFIQQMPKDAELIKAGVGLIAIGAALNIIAAAVSKIGNLSWEQLVKGLSGLIIIMEELAYTLDFMPPDMIQIGVGLVALGAALNIIAVAVAKLGNMSLEQLAKGLGSLVVILTALAVTLDYMPFDMIQIGVGLAALGAALNIMVAAISKLSNMSLEQLAKGLGSLVVILAALSETMYCMPPDMIQVGVGLIAVGVALNIISAALSKMGDMSLWEIVKGLIALGGALYELSIGLALMEGALPGSAALLVASVALLALASAMKTLGSISFGGVIGSLVTLAGTLAILAVASIAFAEFIPLILAFSAAIAVFGVGVTAIGVGLIAIGTGLSAIAVGIGALAAAVATGATAIVAGITVIITGILALIPAIIKTVGEAIIAFYEVVRDSAPTIAEAVQAVVLAIVDSLVTCVPTIADGLLVVVDQVLKSLVAYAPQIINSVMELLIAVFNGVAEHMPDLITAAVNLMGSFFDGIIQALNTLDTGVLQKALLGTALLTVLVAGLAAIKSLIPGAMVALVGMAGVMVELMAILALIGGIAQIPGLKWLIDEGGDMLQSIGTAIGKFVGGIVGGVAAGVTSVLPAIGTNLSEFMTNVQPFVDGASKIDASLLTGIASLAAAILVITATDILTGLASFFTGGNSLARFGEELAEFGPYFSDYYEAIKDIKGDVIIASANAASALSELEQNLPGNGIGSWFAGDWDSFSDGLVDFGEALKDYSDAIDGIKPGAIINSTIAARSLSTLEKNLPDTGLTALFEGDWDSFSDGLVDFGEALKDYSDAIDGIKPGAIIGSAIAAGALSNLYEDLPDTGIRAWFEGDWTSFSDGLVDFGEALKKYSDKLDGISYDSINNSVVAATALSELEQNLPDKGFVSWFEGDWSSFSDGLVEFGKALKGYSDELDGISFDAIDNSVVAATALSELEENLPDTGIKAWFEGDWYSFSDGLKEFGKALTDYSKALSINPDTIADSVTAATALAELEKNLPDTGFKAWFEGDWYSFSDGLKEFGKALTDYNNALTIDPETIDNSITAATALTELEKNFPDKGFTSWFEGDWSSFSDGLVSFGKALTDYSDALNIKPTAIDESITAASALTELEKNLPDTGFKAWFEGDWYSFSDGLVSFGKALTDYSDALNIKPTAITDSATAAMALAELEENLPDTGFTAWWNGEGNWSSFSDGLVSFGKALTDYSDALNIKPTAITDSATAAMALAELEKNLPSKSYDYQGDWTSFSDGLVYFGMTLTTYSNAIAGLDTGVIDNSVTAASALAELEKSLPTSGGLAEFFTGEKSFSTFGDDLVAFASSFVSYANTVSGIETADVISTTSTIRAIVGIASSLSESSSDFDLVDFGKDLSKFGSKFSEYYENIKDIKTSTLTLTTSKLNDLATAIGNLGSIDSTSVSNLGDALTNLSEAGLDEFVASFEDCDTSIDEAISSFVDAFTTGLSEQENNFSSAFTDVIDDALADITGMEESFTEAGQTLMSGFESSVSSSSSSFKNKFESELTSALAAIRAKYSSFMTAGKTCMAQFIAGVSSKRASVLSTFTSGVAKAVVGVRGYYNSFYNAGAYLVSGFAKGISEKTYMATARAKAMASAAETAARNTLAINSPSKVFKKIGASIPEGFAMGIGMLSNVVEGSTVAMANTAIKGTSSAISRISDAISSDIDAQPTICPVLDLSNVESGAGAISSMLSSNTLARVGVVSSMMGQQNQNGANSDIVSAINKLRKDLGNIGGNNYTINGVTYDDGSNVTNAVKELVRYAKIERRV